MLWGPLWPSWWVSPPLWGYWVIPTEPLPLPQAAALCHTEPGWHREAQGSHWMGPAPISQGMGCREGDSKGGCRCLLLLKGE